MAAFFNHVAPLRFQKNSYKSILKKRKVLMVSDFY
jgi:hypothetical protein